MAQKTVYVRQRKKKKKPSMLLPILILFLLSLLIALGIAALWQMLEDRQAEREANSSSSSTSSSLPPSSSGEPDNPDDTAKASGGDAPEQSSSPEQSSAPEGNGDSTDPESGPDSPDDSSSSDAVSDVIFNPPVEYGKPVPKSDPVGLDYFDDALFLGDSITQGIESYGLMSNATVIANKGINPTTFLESAVVPTANGNITMLEAAALEQPAKIYVLLGTNGISWIRESLFIDYYSAIIDQLKADHPNAIIYVQSIFPVTKEKSEQDPQLSNSKIDEYNAAILEMTKEKQVYYLNVAEAIKNENGALPTEASPKDGIHFGTPTYEKWFAYLQEHTIINK